MIIAAIAKLITAIFILRVLFAWSWVHPFNPFFRKLCLLTDWCVKPLHKIFRSKHQAVECTLIALMVIVLRLLLSGYRNLDLAFYTPIVFVLELLDVIYLALLFTIIYSWIAPFTRTGRDIDDAFHTFLEPCCAPFAVFFRAWPDLISRLCCLFYSSAALKCGSKIE